MKIKIATKDFVEASGVGATMGQNNLPVGEFVINHLPTFVYLEVGDDQVITDTPIHKRTAEDESESEASDAAEPAKENADEQSGVASEAVASTLVKYVVLPAAENGVSPAVDNGTHEADEVVAIGETTELDPANEQTQDFLTKGLIEVAPAE